MKIFSFPTLNLTKVVLAAEEVGLDYELDLMEITSGAHKSPEHIERHPLGKVPAIELDGVFYFESNSIVRLLAEKYGQQLYANTPEARAVINQWIDFMGYHAGRWLTVYLFEECFKPTFLESEPNQSKLDEAGEYLTQQLPILEQQLAKYFFICRETISIADIIAFSFIHTTDLTSIDISGFPRILEWKQAMESRPSFINAMSKFPKQDIYFELRK